MQNMPVCPMMMAQMPAMQMQMPMQQQVMPMQMASPMCMQMPMMQPMEHPMTMPAMAENEDDMDEQHFTAMYGDSCHRMIPYVMRAVDRMEEKQDIYEERPDRDMIDRVTDEVYEEMAEDMPDMLEGMENERQIFGPRRFIRDLAGVLLINELLGRRRRRRRHHFGYEYEPDYDYFNGYGPAYGGGFYYYD